MSRSGRAAALALAVFLVSGAAGALVVLLQGKTYRSTAVVGIDQPSVLATTAEPGPVLKLQTLRQQYAALMTTRTVLEPIAERVDRSPSDVQDALQVVAAKDSLLLVVSAHADSARAARGLAEAAADEIISYASTSQDSAGVAREQKVVLTLLSPAQQSVVVTGGTRTLLTTALFVGVVCAAAALALQTWVRNPSR